MNSFYIPPLFFPFFLPVGVFSGLVMLDDLDEYEPGRHFWGTSFPYLSCPYLPPFWFVAYTWRLSSFRLPERLLKPSRVLGEAKKQNKAKQSFSLVEHLGSFTKLLHLRLVTILLPDFFFSSQGEQRIFFIYSCLQEESPRQICFGEDMGGLLLFFSSCQTRFCFFSVLGRQLVVCILLGMRLLLETAAGEGFLYLFFSLIVGACIRCFTKQRE